MEAAGHQGAYRCRLSLGISGCDPLNAPVNIPEGIIRANNGKYQLLAEQRTSMQRLPVMRNNAFTGGHAIKTLSFGFKIALACGKLNMVNDNFCRRKNKPRAYPLQIFISRFLDGP